MSLQFVVVGPMPLWIMPINLHVTQVFILTKVCVTAIACNYHYLSYANRAYITKFCVNWCVSLNFMSFKHGPCH